MISKREILCIPCVSSCIDGINYCITKEHTLCVGGWKDEIVKESALDKRLTNKLCICIGHVANRVLKYQSHIIMT